MESSQFGSGIDFFKFAHTDVGMHAALISLVLMSGAVAKCRTAK